MDQPPQQLTIRITWSGILNYVGALLTTGWALYLFYMAAGAGYTLLAALVFAAILRFGASPVLLLSTGILYFHFDAAGLWLPLLSCAIAILAFRNDIKNYRARQAASQ